jgi:hypothetical protein
MGENTFIWRGDVGGARASVGDAAGGAFSPPLWLANGLAWVQGLAQSTVKHHSLFLVKMFQNRA